MITYSSVDRVLRQVDHITPIVKKDPSPIRGAEDAIHKCRLLDTEIPAITYNSGGTYTLGALQQAIDVLQVIPVVHSRGGGKNRILIAQTFICLCYP